MPRMIYLNFSDVGLAASTRLYEAIGCLKDQQFSSEKKSSMVCSDTITLQVS